MRKCLVFLATGMLFHAVLAVGCAEGDPGETAFSPQVDAAADVTSKGGSTGDASTEAGQEGGAGTAGGAGSSGASGAGGSSGSSGASGKGGSAGGNTGGSNTGGSSTGGSSTGGSSTGGSSTGGSSTGGSSTGGSSTGGSSTGGSSGATAYSHTITIGGGSDFNANEAFATTSAGYTGYVSWDASNVYVGMDGPDIQSAAQSRLVLVYLGVPLLSGTPTGHAYTGQQPSLPFDAHWLFAWGTDGYKELREYTAGQWTTVTFSGSASQSGSTVEISIPRQSLNYPAKLRMHLCMINEMSSGQWTFAGVPYTSFTDKMDPDYGKYFEFDLTSSQTPKSYLPLP